MTEQTKRKKHLTKSQETLEAKPRTSWELYIKTTESSYGGEAESDEEWCHHSDIVREVSFDSVSRQKGSGFFSCGESFEVSEEVWNSEKVYLVIPRYSDGGTFGRTVGYWCIQGAYADEASALKLARSIQGKNFKAEYPEMASAYMPWEGYFSGLQDVEVHCFTIRDGSNDQEGDPSVRYH